MITVHWITCQLYNFVGMNCFLLKLYISLLLSCIIASFHTVSIYCLGVNTRLHVWLIDARHQNGDVWKVATYTMILVTDYVRPRASITLKLDSPFTIRQLLWVKDVWRQFARPCCIYLVVVIYILVGVTSL